MYAINLKNLWSFQCFLVLWPHYGSNNCHIQIEIYLFLSLESLLPKVFKFSIYEWRKFEIYTLIRIYLECCRLEQFVPIQSSSFKNYFVICFHTYMYKNKRTRKASLAHLNNGILYTSSFVSITIIRQTLCYIYFYNCKISALNQLYCKYLS